MAGQRSLAMRVGRSLTRLSRLKSLVLGLRESRDRLLDGWLNIRTAAPPGTLPVSGTHFADAVEYGAVDYLLLRSFMEPIPTRPNDVVVDIGCGMGRTLCLFARREVRNCIGIEFDPALAETARANIGRVRGRRSPVEVLTGDAVDADYTEGTLFWLFHPFGPTTMRIVLEKIHQSLLACPRRIRIAYVNCVYVEEFERLDWLTCTGWKRSPFFTTFTASYWTNEP